MTTKNLLNWLLNGHKISECVKKKYQPEIERFYCEFLKYVLPKMDFVKNSLETCSLDRILLKEDADWSSVEFFVQRFESLPKFNNFEIPEWRRYPMSNQCFIVPF